MLKSSNSECEQLCLPTHQVFDFPEAKPLPHVAESSKSDRLYISIDTSVAPSLSKRSPASPVPSVTKKPRAIAERINTKDFVPPDVSGLSKREARLVKNRAAAFLSRQRKREEFEYMEVRVAQLEQENARLLALTQSGTNSAHSDKPIDHELVSEIETLKAKLTAATEREHQLSAELASRSTPSTLPAIKIETSDTLLSTSSRTPPPSPHKSGASLGLMVLLCALPTLLSMPLHSTVPNSFAIPTPLPAASNTFDLNSFIPNEFDWSRPGGSSIMEIDSDDQGRLSAGSPMTAPPTQKLEFADADSDTVSALGALDISFDATSSDNGKIRVRIHPSSSASSRAASPSVSSSDSKSDNGRSGGLEFTSSSSPSLAMWSGSESEFGLESSFSSCSPGSTSSLFSNPPLLSPDGDPFLGIGGSDYSTPYYSGASPMFGKMGDLLSANHGQLSDLSYGSEHGIGDPAAAGKHRVRIALKSMPSAGGEGGEWEVQLC